MHGILAETINEGVIVAVCDFFYVQKDDVIAVEEGQRSVHVVGYTVEIVFPEFLDNLRRKRRMFECMDDYCLYQLFIHIFDCRAVVF